MAAPTPSDSSGSPEPPNPPPDPGSQPIRDEGGAFQEPSSVELTNGFKVDKGGDLQEPSEKISAKQEDTRSMLALLLVYILAGTYFFIIVFLLVLLRTEGGTGKVIDLSKEFFSLLVSTISGLAGTALGFYFGGRLASEK